jgi:hypothetical protein
MNFGIEELKKHLGPGLGLRKNRYMIEIPVPTVSGETINMLCQSAGLPERNITTTDVWHKGRRFTVRGETDFVGEYTISIVDDDKMRIRELFDTWIKTVDNSRPDPNGSFLGASFEEAAPGAIDEITAGVGALNTVKSSLSNQRQLLDFTIGTINENAALSSAFYQTDINIWQMDSSANGEPDDSKIYGYKLQNAFPKSIGIVTLEDNESNSLSEFSITFAFSEFIPLKGARQDINTAVFGDQTTDIQQGIDNIL